MLFWENFYSSKQNNLNISNFNNSGIENEDNELKD